MRRQLEGQGFHLATLDSLKYSYKILNTDKATRTVYCVKKGLWSEQGSQISTIEILTRAYTTDPIFINLKARKGRKLHKAIFICKTIDRKNCSRNSDSLNIPILMLKSHRLPNIEY